MKRCISCGSEKSTLLFENRDWSIYSCADCGLVRTDRDSSLTYEEYHRDEDYAKFKDLFRNIFLKRFKIVNKYFKKPGIVLDIGASTGVMLEIFKENGWNVWGIEPSRAGGLARKKGIKIIRSTIEKAKLPNNYFDLVILNHTLEHLDNPVKVLKKVKALLKKGGVLLVDVPNFGSLRSKLMGKNWPYLLPQEHNFQFTKQSLKKLFVKTGFRFVAFESRSGIFDHSSPLLEVWQSLVTLKKRFFTNLINLPLDIVSTFFNKGDSMSMVGKKI